ncbi:MAG: hypothetical protein LIP09_16845 [Bacteroidales bacterium]|nr:hypothetical protein [Bacteroidales bacterium]
MKKIYALIACAALAGGMTLSAQVAPNFTKKTPDPSKLMQVNAQLMETSKAQAKTLTGMNAKKVSRADEGYVDVTKFTQNLFYNYFYNWYDQVGSSSTQRDSFLNLMSAQNTILTPNEDGTITIGNFCGWNPEYYSIDVTCPVMKVTDDGRLVMELGQVLAKSGGYTYFVCAVDEQGYEVTSGEIEFEVYSNCVFYGDMIGVGAKSTTTGQFAGWDTLDVYYYLFAPNSTLSYTYSFDGWATTYECDKELYCEYWEADPDDPEDYDRIVAYNVIDPGMLDEGTMVEFGVAGNYAVAAYQTAVPSIYWDSSVQYTGDWSFCKMEGDEITDFIVEGNWDEDSKTLEWETWVAYCMDSSLWLGACSVSTLKYDCLSDGISSVVADSSNLDAATVYYNLQGMQVANPEAGKIYIVKQGNKTTKQIFR